MPTFTPPTVRQAMGGSFWERYPVPVGQSVVKVDGTFTLLPFPWKGELDGQTEGIDYFLGGRTYSISYEISAALEEAGFGTSEFLGYGEGAYGFGPYGG